MTSVINTTDASEYLYLGPVATHFREDGMNYSQISKELKKRFKVDVPEIEIYRLLDELADSYPYELVDLLPLDKVTNHTLQKGELIHDMVELGRIVPGDFAGKVTGDTDEYKVRIFLEDGELVHRCTCEAKIWRTESWCSHEIALLWALFEDDV